VLAALVIAGAVSPLPRPKPLLVAVMETEVAAPLAVSVRLLISESLLSAGLMLSPANVTWPAVAPAVVDVLWVAVPLRVPTAAATVRLTLSATNPLPDSVSVRTGAGKIGWATAWVDDGSVVKLSP
jgi:hypothetical protein